MLNQIKEYATKIGMSSAIIYIVISFLTWNLMWVKYEPLLRAFALVLLTVVLYLLECYKIRNYYKSKEKEAKPVKQDYPF